MFGGAVFAAVLFVVGGGGRLEALNIALAAVAGVVFAAAMYQSARRGPSS